MRFNARSLGAFLRDRFRINQQLSPDRRDKELSYQDEPNRMLRTMTDADGVRKTDPVLNGRLAIRHCHPSLGTDMSG